MYRSSAKIQIIEEDRVGDVFGKNEQSTLRDNQILEKELELLKSDVLFNKVISNGHVNQALPPLLILTIAKSKHFGVYP